jgi:hypothetical protein
MQRKLLNVSKNKSKMYDAQMSQLEKEEIKYDMQGAKIFAVLISYLQDKVQVQCQQVETQHVITYSLKSGVKKSSKKAEEAAVKERQQGEGECRNRNCVKE